MGLSVQDLTLAAATPSGGTQLASAGSGLPQRLTPADDVLLDAVSDVSTGLGGAVMDPDGLHVWTTNGSNTIKKINIASGSTVLSFTNNSSDGGARTISNPRNLTRRGTKIYGANAGTNNYIIEIDTVALTCRLYSNSVVTSPVHVISNANGLCWARPANAGNATMTELALSGTGDSAAAVLSARGTPTISSVYGACGDGGAGVYIYYANNTSIVRYKLSDSSITTLSGVAVGVSAMPGYGATFRGVIWDYQLQQPVAWQTGATWVRVHPDCSTFDGPAYGDIEYGALMMPPSNLAPGLADWLDDGSLVCWQAPKASGSPTLPDSIRVRILGVQRARWTWVPGVACTLKRITVPGDLGNLRGAITGMAATPGFMQAVYDQRRTKTFYQVNASPRVEYKGGTLAVALAASDTLTVDVDFQHYGGMPGGPFPFVGGDSGEGVQLLYDTGSTSPRRARIQNGL